MLERIEPHLRSDEALDKEADLVVRGWPLTVEGLLANAAQGMQRFSWRGVPHYSVVLATYTGNEAQRLGDTLGPVHRNPHFVGRKR